MPMQAKIGWDQWERVLEKNLNFLNHSTNISINFEVDFKQLMKIDQDFHLKCSEFDGDFDYLNQNLELAGFWTHDLQISGLKGEGKRFQ